MKKLVFLGLVVGLFAACNEAKEAETTDEQQVENQEQMESAEAVTVSVDEGNSQVVWVGQKVSDAHEGTLNLKDGELTIKDGELLGGKFTIDMTSLKVTDKDLPEEPSMKLTGHLKGSDFFNVEEHPAATFEITKVEKAEGAATHKISGNLTMLGKTKNITFPATVKVENGKVMASSEMFKINRKEWGINYKGQPDDMIKEEVGIQIASLKTK